MKQLILLILFNFHLVILSFSQQQGLFMPREIQRATSNGTRTLKGLPGNNYWQNNINYTIEVNFNPETGHINGKEIVKYKNNSPSPLYNLIVNLYPNLFKKGNARDREVVPDDVHDGFKLSKISIDDIEINSSKCSYEGTYVNIKLPKPLFSKNELKISMEWAFNMQQQTTIRVGKYCDKTWFIGYWYPQIAVNDDIFGWDDINYDGLHEFYSPFANFDVTIKVPANQIIWATGIWQNPTEILNKKYLDRYNLAMKSEKVVRIVELDDLKSKITKSSTENSWRFFADNVTDFSFATSDTYLWDGVNLKTEKATNKETFIQTAYNKSAIDFFDVAEISKRSIQYLSDSMPGIPFPYPRMTVFNGGGGMEFPMMVNDRSENSYSSTVNLTSHEISHTYFPFYMGINQERYSWMDEGWAQFLPAEFQEQQASQNNKRAESAFNFAYYAGNSLEMPMMVPSFYVKGYEYYVASYYRPELAYRFLQNLLGNDLFKKALHEYINRWNGKYPSPYDFFFTFNDIAGEDLSWFWNPWFFELGYPDLAIDEVKTDSDNIVISLSKSGNIPTRVEINLFYTDGTSDTICESASVWKGNTKLQLKHKSDKTIKFVKLGSEVIPDVNQKDNIFKLN